MARSHKVWWWQSPTLEWLVGRGVPRLFVPTNSCVSGLGVHEAAPRSSAYLESVILKLLMACFVPLDQLPCLMRTDHYDFLLSTGLLGSLVLLRLPAFFLLSFMITSDLHDCLSLCVTSLLHSRRGFTMRQGAVAAPWGRWLRLSPALSC